MVSKTFPIWKTITIGGKTKDQLFAELKVKGFGISEWARDMMTKKAFTTAAEPRDLDLALVTVRDLGFTKDTKTREIWSKAKELGLDLCPAEVGPHLRLVYADQPKYEYLSVAMEQITGSDGPSIFLVGHADSVRCGIGHTNAKPEEEWDLDTQIVFVLPRKPAA